MDSFSDQLRAEAEPIWRAIFAHPFLRQIKDGTLPLETSPNPVLRASTTSARTTSTSRVSPAASPSALRRRPTPTSSKRWPSA